MASISLKTITKRIQQGAWPYVITVAHMLLGTIWVYSSPRSIIAFLVLLSSFASLYYFKTSSRFKILVGAILALLIMPVLGVRNIFYLEVIFQISVFAALALGLNIVVGFAGLLDLGYVAFYAVGAYLWAFFGSQQYYVLPFAPGTQPAHLPFLLPGDMFYLFIFLAVIAAAMTGILLGLPVLRVRGDYLAIVTLGFGELIRVMANNLDKPLNFTNGPQGITPIQRPTMPQAIVDSFNAVFGRLVGHPADIASVYNVMFYLLALLVILIIDDEAVVEGQVLGLAAQQAGADGMEGPQPQPVGGQVAEHIPHPVAHLAGGLVGECDRQHLVRAHTFVGDQIGHPLGENASLAGPRSGQH